MKNKGASSRTLVAGACASPAASVDQAHGPEEQSLVKFIAIPCLAAQTVEFPWFSTLNSTMLELIQKKRSTGPAPHPGAECSNFGNY